MWTRISFVHLFLTLQWNPCMFGVFASSSQASEVNGSRSTPPFPSPSLTLPGPHSEANPWESCTFPGRHGYVQIGGRKGTWVGSHQRNNMCARHRAGSRALQSKSQKARNYRCLSFSITESLNTSGGTTRPPPAPLQLGGKLSLSNNPQLGYFLLVQGHLKQLGQSSGSCRVTVLAVLSFMHRWWLLVHLWWESSGYFWKEKPKCALLIQLWCSDDLLHKGNKWFLLWG